MTQKQIDRTKKINISRGRKTADKKNFRQLHFKMRKLIGVFLLLAIISITSYSQNISALWPIEGKKAGEDILYQPQDYIGEEKNIDNLFIGATEGTVVIAPIDGIIEFVRYGYTPSLVSATTFKFILNPTSDIAEYDIQQRKLMAESRTNVIPEFISLNITISATNGEKFYISGIRPITYFKTGYKIKKGEVIGTVGFCYKAIPKASIRLARTVSGKSADPMAPFGLKSRYITYKTKLDFSIKIPVNNLIEDFSVFREALEEGHPGLTDYTSKANMDMMFKQTLSKITQPMKSEEFQRLLLPIIDSVRDSHTSLSLRSDNPSSQIVDLPIHFGELKDSIIVYQTLPEYNNLLGKTIVDINGVSSKNLVKDINIQLGKCDGYISSQNDYYRSILFYAYYRIITEKVNGDKVTIKFSDGTQSNLIYQSLNDFKGFVPARRKNSRKGNFETKIISDRIAYLGIYTFDLTETDLDSINMFIKEISTSSYNNLLIDLRGNRGGTECYANIFSLLVEKPFKTSTLSMVKNNGIYNFFKYCSNYNPDTQLFSRFEKLEGKEGYYEINNNFVKPNDSIHYSGNVYVLTDEFSCSASTVFAGLVHKYQRGKIVGRETGSSYYQLNADKFANVYLKNSGLELRIPLIKEIFDDEIDKTIPWGRGVIPDYPTKLSFDDFFGNEDKMLKYTLQIIQESVKSESLSNN